MTNPGPNQRFSRHVPSLAGALEVHPCTHGATLCTTSASTKSTASTNRIMRDKRTLGQTT
ncbi:MAG: hypothetical protein IPM54_45700 [Polyangiaceae bacterium]|nr:hypothetical protein [Polyangiaceae bacterium]